MKIKLNEREAYFFEVPEEVDAHELIELGKRFIAISKMADVFGTPEKVYIDSLKQKKETNPTQRTSRLVYLDLEKAKLLLKSYTEAYGLDVKLLAVNELLRQWGIKEIPDKHGILSAFIFEVRSKIYDDRTDTIKTQTIKA